MAASAPLIISNTVKRKLGRLRAQANQRPIDVRVMMEEIKTPGGDHRHRSRISDQTVEIPGPWPFRVTFSIENGHPVGTCRHMSMSIRRENRVPSPEAVWIIAEELGFIGSLALCRTYPEDLEDNNKAINIVQPVALQLGNRSVG